jgi:protein-S-isoprenylcysteine O-methyltransferase Ste14
VNYISMNIAGFVLLFLFDVASLKRTRGVKPVIWLTANLLLISSVLLMAFSPEKVGMPQWANWLGWGLLPPAIFCKLHPLLISLPFRKTYWHSGVGDRLVTSGFYALVRCPWIHSMALILIALILISGSQLLIIASPIIVAVNMLLAVVQDKLLFGRMFSGYQVYRNETPMLIPNRKSLRRFFLSIKSEVGARIPGGSVDHPLN